MSHENFDAIREDYLSSLQDLKFNSRPIITTLTVIAQENSNAAEVITKTIEEHILKVSIKSKVN